MRVERIRWYCGLADECSSAALAISIAMRRGSSVGGEVLKRTAKRNRDSTPPSSVLRSHARSAGKTGSDSTGRRRTAIWVLVLRPSH